MIYGFIPFGFCGKISTGKFVFSPPPVEIFNFFFFFFLYPTYFIFFVYIIIHNIQQIK